MRALALLCATALELHAACAVARQVPPVSVGQQVRVSVPVSYIHSGRAMGVVTRATNQEIDLLVVQRRVSGTDRWRSDTLRLAVPLDSVQHLEVATARVSNSGRGFLLGAAIGGGVGLVLVGAAAAEGGAFAPTVGDIPVGGLAGALMGGVVGLVVGSLSQRTTWLVIPLARSATQVSVRPRCDGLAVSLSF